MTEKNASSDAPSKAAQNREGKRDSEGGSPGMIGTGPEGDHGRGETSTQRLAALELLFKWRNLIVINVLVACIVAAGISFMIPKTYKATASVLPPKQADIFSSLGGVASSIAKSIPGASRLGFGQRSAGYNYFAILNSRSSLEGIVRQFNLISVYDIKDSSMEKAVRELSNNVSFEEQTDDYITIEVRDRDPQRAAAMANAFVDVLNRISVQLGTAEARNNREFIGQRLGQAQVDLRKAEDDLKSYQEKSKMIITSEQSASLSGMASLYALRARKEVELGVLQHSVDPSDPSVRSLRLEVAEIDRKLSDLPEIGVESLRRYRDVLIQQQIVEFLIPMFEQAKIDEVKDIPVVLSLDKAIPPEKRASPQRSIIVLVTFFLSTFLCILLVYTMEWFTRVQPPGPVGVKLSGVSRSVARFYKVVRN